MSRQQKIHTLAHQKFQTLDQFEAAHHECLGDFFDDVINETSDEIVQLYIDNFFYDQIGKKIEKLIGDTILDGEISTIKIKNLSKDVNKEEILIKILNNNIDYNKILDDMKDKSFDRDRYELLLIDETNRLFADICDFSEEIAGIPKKVLYKERQMSPTRQVTPTIQMTHEERRRKVKPTRRIDPLDEFL